MYVCALCARHVQGTQKKESYPLRLQLQQVVSCLVGLGDTTPDPLEASLSPVSRNEIPGSNVLYFVLDASWSQGFNQIPRKVIYSDEASEVFHPYFCD